MGPFHDCWHTEHCDAIWFEVAGYRFYNMNIHSCSRFRYFTVLSVYLHAYHLNPQNLLTSLYALKLCLWLDCPVAKRVVSGRYVRYTKMRRLNDWIHKLIRGWRSPRLIGKRSEDTYPCAISLPNRCESPGSLASAIFYALIRRQNSWPCVGMICHFCSFLSVGVFVYTFIFIEYFSILCMYVCLNIVMGSKCRTIFHLLFSKGVNANTAWNR